MICLCSSNWQYVLLVFQNISESKPYKNMPKSFFNWILNLKEGFQIDLLQCILVIEPCLECLQAGGMSTGHRGTATWQPQSVKHSLWNPLLSPHEDELTVQFSVIKRFELFFQLFNLKMWDKKLPVSSLPKNAFLVESSTLLHSVAQTHHEWAPRQLWGAMDT